MGGRWGFMRSQGGHGLGDHLVAIFPDVCRVYCALRARSYRRWMVHLLLCMSAVGRGLKRRQEASSLESGNTTRTEARRKLWRYGAARRTGMPGDTTEAELVLIQLREADSRRRTSTPQPLQNVWKRRGVPCSVPTPLRPPRMGMAWPNRARHDRRRCGGQPLQLRVRLPRGRRSS
ncbi:hypothetical protein BD413DRAFT_553915 [Trametes elegans]|nr:hypothetical protein BD413DRAFT_553915 [Trametes elegans]